MNLISFMLLCEVQARRSLVDGRGNFLILEIQCSVFNALPSIFCVIFLGAYHGHFIRSFRSSMCPYCGRSGSMRPKQTKEYLNTGCRKS